MARGARRRRFRCPAPTKVSVAATLVSIVGDTGLFLLAATFEVLAVGGRLEASTLGAEHGGSPSA